MARKSRSKQRGKGVGTRSGTGGGGTGGGGNKGGSRGGGGRNNPGSNKNARGKTNTSSNKTSPGNKNNKTSPGNKNKNNKNTGGGTKKKTARERTQEAAKKRREAGISVSDAVSMNKQSMKDRARERHAKFKKDGFQTKGGRFAKDSEGRVYDARKKALQDKARERHQKYTQARKEAAVDRKSARLAAATGIPSGDKLPAGSFGISQAGREQAAANRMAARQTMNLNTGLNIGSKFKDGQKVATNYNDLPSGLQNILQNQLKSFERQGQGEKELKRLKNMYPGFMPRADAGEVFGTLASLNPAAQLGNLVLGGPASAAQFKSDTGDEGAAGTPESGGLSIGQNQEETGNPLSRALQIGQGLVNAYNTVSGFAADIANQAFSPSLADGTLKGNMDLAGRLPGDAGFNMNDVNTKAAINSALNSEGVKQIGRSFGLPDNFQAQARGVVDALTDNFTGATADRDGVYEGVSETLRTLSQDDRLAPVAKFLGQRGTDNENVSDAERNESFKIAGFNTPFTNETVADIVSSFQPNVTKMPGLSKEDRGVLEGGVGNRLVSGKFTDAAREALTGYGGDSVANLGLERGTPLSIANVYDASRMMAQNAAEKGTLANRRFTEIGNLADQSGRITGPSIIKGITGFGNKRGGNTNQGVVPGANQPAPTLVPEEILEFLEPTIPSTETSEINLPEFVDPTDAYNDALNEFLYNPNYFPQVQQYQKPPVKTFAQTFNRDYF